MSKYIAMTAISTYENQKLDLNRRMTSPGDFRFVSASVAGIDFIGRLISITIFEDLGPSARVTGEMLCIDTQNAPSTMPFIGGETVKFSIKDCYGVQEDFEFTLTKVSNRSPISLGSLSYVIHFACTASILSSMRKISKAYQKKKFEEIAKDVIDSYMTAPGKSIDYDFAETNSLLSCVIPNWRPSHALTWITSRAVCGQTEFSYSPYTTFMERSGKITSVPLDFLYSESSNVTKGQIGLKFGRPNVPGTTPSLVSDPRMSHQILALEDLNIVKTTDYIENLMAGMYSNEVTKIDLFTRTNDSLSYSYVSETRESSHISLNGNPFVREGMLGFDEPSHWRSAVSHHGLFSDMNYKAEINDYIHYHVSKWQQTEQMIIQGVLPGHFGLRVGQKYEIDLPSYRDISTTEDRKDYYYSGKYIVEKIKHEFAADNHYYATCQFFTDSVSKKIEKIEERP